MLRQVVRRGARRPGWWRSLSTVWGTSEDGAVGSYKYRLFVTRAGQRVSAWHDIPLFSSGPLLLNYVNEIPKGTRRKMEISKDDDMNPIRQDINKAGELREFKIGDIPFNYGALPQTWEDPQWVHPDARCGGDDDPLDAVEVSETPMAYGEIATVHVLGIVGLIDQNEADWKVIVRKVPEESSGGADAGAPVPEANLDAIREFFSTYKIAEGYPIKNKLLFDGRLMPADYALDIIREAHHHWQQIRPGCKKAACSRQ
ncbi:inorganic diphosphatase [Plasmodiophora brassicae]